jgi:transposase-like protein
MPLTPTSLCCSKCDCQQLKTRKSYTLKGGVVRQLYRCPECQHCFSETHDTPLANLKTPLSQIVLILQALNEGLGINAVCRLFRVSKNSLYRWQERLSNLKPTLLLYALCHQFLNLVIEGDERYTKIKKTFPQRTLKGGLLYCWSGRLALSGNSTGDVRIASFSIGRYGRWSR